MLQPTWWLFTFSEPKEPEVKPQLAKYADRKQSPGQPRCSGQAGTKARQVSKESRKRKSYGDEMMHDADL
jgi:hypothetical protein